MINKTVYVQIRYFIPFLVPEFWPCFRRSAGGVSMTSIVIEADSHSKHESQKYQLLRDYFAVILRPIPFNLLKNCANA